VPLTKQATFSIWESEAEMKAYAYKMRAHQEVIKRTRDENWYSEEMFLRFRLLDDIC
jgi:heme-degrading monooxygenase HmoA